MEHMKIAVTPGIGDSLWCLTKVPAILEEAGVEKADLFIPQNAPPHRSHDFLRMFDFVNEVHYVDIPFQASPGNDRMCLPDGTYNYVCTRKNWRGFEWWLAPNWELEKGIRLENWLPQYETDWRIRDRMSLPDDDYPKFNDPYIAIYLGPLSGCTADGHNRCERWSKQDWFDLVGTIMEKTGYGVIVVGADYDRSYAQHFFRERAAANWVDAIGKWRINQTFHVLQRAEMVISYQCGLGIWSVFAGKRVVMWWREYGDPINPGGLTFDHEMAKAWAPMDALKSKRYLPQVYNHSTPESVLGEMEDAKWI